MDTQQVGHVSGQSAPDSATPLGLSPSIAPLVLLVEDDKGMRKYLRERLSRIKGSASSRPRAARRDSCRPRRTIPTSSCSTSDCPT